MSATSATFTIPDAAFQPSIGLPEAQPSDDLACQDQTTWPIWSSLVQWIGTARSLALLGGSAGAATTASAGVGLLIWLYVTRTFTPASAHVVKPLYFDYTKLQAVATTSMVSKAHMTAYAHTIKEANPQQKSTQQLNRRQRFLAPGEAVTIWLDLRMPRTTVASDDLFQAVGEIYTADGQQLSRSSRPTFPVSTALQSFAWDLWIRPLKALGFLANDVRLKVVLFERYVEQIQQPFVLFHCALHGRAGGGLPPPVITADLHVQLHLGAWRSILYWVRPGWLLTVCLAVIGLCAIVGGSSCAALLFALWLWSISVGDGSPDITSPEGPVPRDHGISSGDDGSHHGSEVLSDSDESAGWVKDMGESDEALPAHQSASPPFVGVRISESEAPLDQDESIVASSSGGDLSLPAVDFANSLSGRSLPRRRR